MKTNQIADLQISVQYLTSLVESLQKEVKNDIFLKFQPDIRQIVQACIVLKLKFDIKYKDGDLDVIYIQFPDSSIVIQSDLTAYEMGSTFVSQDISFDDVIKRIAGF